MRLILQTWKNQPGDYFCLATKSGKNWKEHFFSRKEFKKVIPFIRSNLDKNLYWCPHGFSRKRRIKAYAVMPKLLWSDIDELDPYKIDPIPSIVWESSPKRYAGLWVLDQPIKSDDINRKLTYHIDADKGGWDLTQVLRVPGSKNYKYPSQPISKLLWNDQRSYTLKEINKILSIDNSSLKDNTETNYKDIWKKYEKTLSREIRKEIINGKPTKGKRSEVLWKIENALIEAGIPIDDCVAIIKNSAWNKFSGRRDELTQLRREFDKIIENRLQSPKPKDDQKNDYKFLSTSIKDIEEKPIDWVWYPYLAKKEITIMEGHPGVGKSYLMQMISKAICDNEELPCWRTEMRRKQQGKIAYFDIENTGSISKNRLIANGLKNEKDFIIEEEPFTVDDEEIWEEVLEAIEREKPKVIIFDTLNTYIGGIDTFNGAQVQQSFIHFRNIAKQYNCAVVVIRHWNKGSKDKSLIDRGAGSISFAGLARVVMAAIPHPEELGWNLLSVIKTNVALYPPPLSYGIFSNPSKKDPDRSKFIWGKFEQGIDFQEASNKEKPKENSKTKYYKSLDKILKKNEWIKKKEIISLTNKQCLPQRSVERYLSILKQSDQLITMKKKREVCYKKRVDNFNEIG